MPSSVRPEPLLLSVASKPGRAMASKLPLGAALEAAASIGSSPPSASLPFNGLPAGLVPATSRLRPVEIERERIACRAGHMTRSSDAIRASCQPGLSEGCDQVCGDATGASWLAFWHRVGLASRNASTARAASAPPAGTTSSGQSPQQLRQSNVLLPARAFLGTVLLASLRWSSLRWPTASRRRCVRWRAWPAAVRRRAWPCRP